VDVQVEGDPRHTNDHVNTQLHLSSIHHFVFTLSWLHTDVHVNGTVNWIGGVLGPCLCEGLPCLILICVIPLEHNCTPTHINERFG
jgi:hypothetical protein